MEKIKRGLAPVREATTLQVFLQASGYDVVPDGNFGLGTEKALKQFQQDNGLIVDGVAGEKTWTTLFAKHPDLLTTMSAKWLSQADISNFADSNRLTVPLVRAVYAVESGGSGFIGDKPKILFEGHVMWSQLKALGMNPLSYVAGNEDILFEKYTKSSYVGGAAEYQRLDRARKISDTAALSSASWGLFQILGLHAKPLGYADVQSFVAKMTSSEADQLDAFGKFIQIKQFKGRPLIDSLRIKDWATFAEGYNGSSYKTNKYDEKLAQAHAEYSNA